MRENADSWSSLGCGGWGELHMTHPQSRVKVEKVGLLQIVIVVSTAVPALSMEDVEWDVITSSREASYPDSIPLHFCSFCFSSCLYFLYNFYLSFLFNILLSFILPTSIVLLLLA
jgi:hypothetical protein